VKQNGGDIAIRSRPETGTNVEIYLPRVAEAAEKPTAEVTRPPYAQGMETVLLVEDEDLVRRVVASILRKKGYTVLEARNGQEALSLCAHTQGQIDLLITDVIMPEMNGRQLANRITQKHPEMAVLYMSGYSEDIVAHRGILEAGIDFIDKAHVSSHLARKVRQVLSGRRKNSEADPPLQPSPAPASLT
jgi:CheY-like chemotaxis protein